jgi:hypothetical protein
LRRWAGLLALSGVGVALSSTQILAGIRPVADTLLSAIGFAASAVIGGLIVVRRGGHPTGWLVLLLGLAILFADGFAYVPGVTTAYVSWVESWVWTAVFALFAVLTLTFPSGELPEGRGRWARVARGAVIALPFLVAMAALTESLGGPEASTPTPNSVGFLPEWLGYLSMLSVVAIFLGGALSLVVNRRRTVGAERAQLTWVVFALVSLVTTVTLTFIYIFVSIGVGAGDPGDSIWSPTYVMMIMFPVSFGVAVLKYRLYEIDRIISRTVSYALVASLLLAVFFGVVAVLTILVPAESDLAIAASTLAVAALFNPLRSRIQIRVDRQFNRARYDAEQVMDGFAGSLRDEVDDGRVVDGWMEVVSATMQPETIGVWVRS